MSPSANYLAAAGCAAVLAGCAHAPPAAAPTASTAGVPAAPDVVLASPTALPPRSATQVIRAIYGTRAMTLRTAIELDATKLKVVGVTATGQRLFTVGWDGKSESADWSAFVPEGVAARRVLSDVQLALWPLSAVQSAFEPAGLEVTEPFAGVRRLRRGDRLVAEVHYTTPDPWNGRLWFVNFEFDYSLTIDTVTDAPN